MELARQGYFGSGAILSNFKLSAIQRPGWVQIYKFDVSAKRQEDNSDDPNAKTSPDFQSLFGLVKDDGREKSQVEFFSDPIERQKRFSDWSHGMIVRD